MIDGVVSQYYLGEHAKGDDGDDWILDWLLARLICSFS